MSSAGGTSSKRARDETVKVLRTAFSKIRNPVSDLNLGTIEPPFDDVTMPSPSTN
jgi:hypothetical protein